MKLDKTFKLQVTAYSRLNNISRNQWKLRDVKVTGVAIYTETVKCDQNVSMNCA